MIANGEEMKERPSDILNPESTNIAITAREAWTAPENEGDYISDLVFSDQSEEKPKERGCC